MKLFMILVGACALSNALASASAPTWVVFIRNNEIYTARGGGSGLRQLTSDSKPKQMPKWSPDGSRIAYFTTGDMSRDPKSHAKIEIISADGQRVATVPVLATMTDGTEVGGMRWVDSIGWFDARHVFADGEGLNPHVGEFRTIDIATGKMGGGCGRGFRDLPFKGAGRLLGAYFPSRQENAAASEQGGYGSLRLSRLGQASGHSCLVALDSGLSGCRLG